MADAIRRSNCNYSASGHVKHPIQYKLALRNSDPRELELVAPHDTGWILATTDGSDILEIWSMHQEWRDVLARAFATAHRTVTAWDYGLAKVGQEYISYCSPEGYKECPDPAQMSPLMTGLVTREQLREEMALRSRSNGDPDAGTEKAGPQ